MDAYTWILSVYFSALICGALGIILALLLVTAHLERRRRERNNRVIRRGRYWGRA